VETHLLNLLLLTYLEENEWFLNGNSFQGKGLLIECVEF
jgi:hypothetical protein